MSDCPQVLWVFEDLPDGCPVTNAVPTSAKALLSTANLPLKCKLTLLESSVTAAQGFDVTWDERRGRHRKREDRKMRSLFSRRSGVKPFELIE